MRYRLFDSSGIACALALFVFSLCHTNQTLAAAVPDGPAAIDAGPEPTVLDLRSEARLESQRGLRLEN